MKEKKGNQYRVPQNQYRVPQNQTDALVLALKLALTAPSKTELDKVMEIVKDLANGLSEIDIARCKRQALKDLQEGAIHV